MVSVYERVTNVEVSAPDWARIEAIFSIFEEAKSDATIYAAPGRVNDVETTTRLDLPTFSLRKRLPSCAVDRSLLERLELYFRNDIPVVASIPDEGRRLTLNLEITDTLGTDKRTTIDTYPLTKFPDGTEQVDLSSTVSGANDEHLTIRLRFNKDRDYSSVSIDSKVPQAREIAVAALEGIVHRLRPNTNLNKLLNWPLGLDFGAVSIVSALLCSAWVVLLISQPARPITWIFFFAALILPTIYAVAKRGYPYTSFDSAVQRRQTSRAKWITLTILSVFLVGTIARLLQRLILNW